jgi:1-acyl-sn-glycerol-3-phosphate acyltransferase
LIFYYQGERSDFAAFVGEETLLQNLRRVLGATGVTVEVEFLAPIWVPEDGEPPPRAELGRLARHAIHEALARRS